ncbi:hypothetical protein C8Q77DRAFT_616295 [Trametes polyzona]|nr:hypothetical protein C8Q77DRAFT_616295 [Trametes polyzona]
MIKPPRTASTAVQPITTPRTVTTGPQAAHSKVSQVTDLRRRTGQSSDREVRNFRGPQALHHSQASPPPPMAVFPWARPDRVQGHDCRGRQPSPYNPRSLKQFISSSSSRTFQRSLCLPRSRQHLDTDRTVGRIQRVS